MIARTVKTGQARSAHTRRVSRDLRYLLPTLAALTQRRLEPEALGATAERLELSPWHAQRKFAQAVGQSPKQYQLRLRLEAAAASLVSTEARVVDIALGVGFDTHEGFSRAFARRFGVSPREYRRRFSPDAALEPDLPSTIGTVGPCISIYGQPLNVSPKKNTMNYDITIKQTDDVHTLFISRRCDAENLAAVLTEILPAVYGYAMGKGLPMSGPPFMQIVEQSAAFITLKGGVPLAAPFEVADNEQAIEAGVLPGGKTATTIHTGLYDGLSDAQAAMERWVDAEGHTARAPMWFVYLTDPAEVPNPEEWQTQVLCPIE